MKKVLLLSLVSLAIFMPQLSGVISLDLSDKGLTSLEELQNIPADVRNEVRILNLNSNQLQTLPANIFNGLNNLRELHLSSNKLKTLPTGIFSDLNSLHTLSLDNNQLQALPTDIFDGLNNLEYLYLSYNQLQSLPVTIFSSLSNLEQLSLWGNPFRAGFFLSLPNIVRSIPTLRFLDDRPVHEALQNYRLQTAPSLQEITKEYAMQNLTPEQLEELAQTNPTAFDVLPLSESVKEAILDRVTAKSSAQQTTQS